MDKLIGFEGQITAWERQGSSVCFTDWVSCSPDGQGQRILLFICKPVVSRCTLTLLTVCVLNAPVKVCALFMWFSSTFGCHMLISQQGAGTDQLSNEHLLKQVFLVSINLCILKLFYYKLQNTYLYKVYIYLCLRHSRLNAMSPPRTRCKLFYTTKQAPFRNGYSLS